MTKGHIKTLGSSNHTEQVREINDYYATNSDDVKIFLDKLQQDGIILKNTILEPACGQGHISDVLIAKGHTVQSSDLIDRGYGLELDYLTSPLKSIYTYSYRIGIGKSGEFNGGNAVAYCWFIWEKGFNKESIIRFIPNPKWTSRGAE